MNFSSFIVQLEQLRFHTNLSIVSVKSNEYFLRKKDPPIQQPKYMQYFTHVIISLQWWSAKEWCHRQKDRTELKGFYSNRAESWKLKNLIFCVQRLQEDMSSAIFDKEEKSVLAFTSAEKTLFFSVVSLWALLCKARGRDV